MHWVEFGGGNASAEEMQNLSCSVRREGHPLPRGMWMETGGGWNERTRPLRLTEGRWDKLTRPLCLNRGKIHGKHSFSSTAVPAAGYNVLRFAGTRRLSSPYLSPRTNLRLYPKYPSLNGQNAVEEMSFLGICEDHPLSVQRCLTASIVSDSSRRFRLTGNIADGFTGEHRLEWDAASMNQTRAL